MKLPIKTRILEYAIEQKCSFTAKQVADALKSEYKGERTSSDKNIENLLYTYCGVGVMQAANVTFDENHNLLVEYEVTDFGRSYEKLIPGH